MFARYRCRSFVSAVALATCAGCTPPPTSGLSHGEPSATLAATTTTSGSSVMRVATIKPVRKTLVRRVEQPGEIHAFEQTPLYSKVTGFVSTIHVDIGDRVKTGQLLAEISIPEYEQELKQKQALVAQAAAETTQAQASIKVAKSSLQSAQALAAEAEAGQERLEAEFQRATSELERFTALFAEKAITQKTLDETQATHRAANAARSEAKARIISAQAVVAEKQAGVEQAQADALAIASKEDVAKADEQRLRAVHEYTRILAPYNSIVTERNIDAGHLVQPGKSASDKPLFVVVQADTVRVFVDVPEADAGFVSKDCEASIRIPSAGNRTIAGKVTRTAWLLHPTTRTLRAEIDMPNEDGTLRPGMYVIADLKVAERPDTYALPRTAILWKDQQASCLTVNADNVIVRIPIVTGIRAGEEVEIVSGLTGDERIIAGNVAAYREGQSVEVVSIPPK
ncbi:Multidrug resistance protein MdtA precursor [Anatilimnocola aggregata]|uniref:Multidrug resistance protein MdtA n=1 Tax=Anatilimnocola aggregata TaxID=2528021 RepID=A0A517Y6N8_9BACT|nr:efflux RND transporter periplasmic adaptor subunit [Anatilimnocola aggregata]QDU25899.1 Multidrug resistance protein MdtA precursor [Anatilimnocola aggregata]